MTSPSSLPLEQEMYWRIPPSLGPAQLLEAAEALSQSSAPLEDEEQEDTSAAAHSSSDIPEMEEDVPRGRRLLDSSSDEGGCGSEPEHSRLLPAAAIHSPFCSLSESRLEIVMPSDEQLLPDSESEEDGDLGEGVFVACIVLYICVCACDGSMALPLPTHR